MQNVIEKFPTLDLAIIQANCKAEIEGLKVKNLSETALISGGPSRQKTLTMNKNKQKVLC